MTSILNFSTKCLTSVDLPDPMLPRILEGVDTGDSNDIDFAGEIDDKHHGE